MRIRSVQTGLSRCYFILDIVLTLLCHDTVITGYREDYTDRKTRRGRDKNV